MFWGERCSGERGALGREREQAGQRCLYLEEGCGSLKAHVGHRDPLAVGQVGIAGADAGEGGEGQDPRGQGCVQGVGPVHLVRVAERPSSGQGIHNLDGKEVVSRVDRALGQVTCRPAPHAGAHLGHLAGSWRLGALEGGHLLAGELQVPLARGLEAAVADAAVVQAPALPVLPLQLPVAAHPEPLGCAPVEARGEGAGGCVTRERPQ